MRFFRVETWKLLLGLMIVIYTAVLSHFSILKHNSFSSYAWDLGMFNQSFWTTINLRMPFYSNVEILANPSGSFFGIHFSPIIFLVLPFYTICPAPQTLLVFQSFILALSTVPLYKLAHDITRYRSVGLLFSLIFLLYPPLQGANWFDFHLQCFLPLFFFSSIYFLQKKRWVPYFVSVLLALMVEEHAAMMVFFIGLLVAVVHRRHLLPIVRARRLRDTILLVSVATVIVSVAWYLMTIWFRNTLFPINPDFASTFRASANWSVLGVQDPLMIPFWILRYPTKALSALSYDYLLKIGYLLALFVPFAFSSFFKAKYLIPTIPWFMYSLFSNYNWYYMIYDQYSAYVVAFIAVAAVYATSELSSSTKGLRKRLMIILLCAAISSALISPLSPMATFVSEGGVRPFTRHEQVVHDILRWIPSEASIITQNNLFPHVSSRTNAYAIPSPVYQGMQEETTEFVNKTLDKVDYALLDLKRDAFSSGVVFSLLNERDDFGLEVSGDGIVLFRKGFSGVETNLVPYQIEYDYRNIVLYSGELVLKMNSSSYNVLHFSRSLGEPPLLWYTSRTLIPPGQYNVTLRLWTNGPNDSLTVDLCSHGGQTVLTSSTYNSSDASDTWVEWSFQTVVDKPLVDFEVRAVNTSEAADIYLDCIRVVTVQ